jgi:type IV pilus assembly protein PilV
MNFKSNKGSSLIEVMVSLFILAIGLLGMLKMQIHSMKLNRSGYYATQSTFLISQITDNIRSNYKVTSGYTTDFDDPAPIVTKDCAVETCTRFEMRDYDLAAWMEAVKTTLPLAKTRILPMDDGYAVTIQYDDGIHTRDVSKPHVIENTVVTQFPRDL